MNIVAQITAIAGRARTGAAHGRVVVPAAIAVAAIAGVSGCSAAGTHTPSVHAKAAVATASPSATPSAPSAPSTPAPTPPAAPTATPSAASTPQAPPAPSGSANGPVTARVTVLNPQNGLVPGGSAVRFLVTVTNTGSQSYSNVLPLVSLGHCSCTASSLFPAGRLQERESTSNVWQTIPYNTEGFGTDYLNADEPGGIQELDPGAVATFEYRVALSPATSAQVTRGTAAFDVTLEFLPGHGLLGVAPSGSAAIVIQAGQPPA
jgi:hypothetical protein